MLWRFWMTCVVVIGCCGVTKVSGGVIEDFARRHCIDCHGSGTREGDFSIEGVFEPTEPSARAALLEKIVDKIEHRQMPPESRSAFFESTDTQATLASLRSELLVYYGQKKQSGFGGVQRLRSDQYVNTLQDLLGYPFRDLESVIPTDSPDSRQAAEISYYHFDRYVESADIALRYAIDRQLGSTRTYVFNLQTAYKSMNWLRADHVRAPTSEEWGVMIAGSRANTSSTYAEVYTVPVAEAGLYRIKARVYAEHGPVTFYVAARHSPPEGVVWGVMGSRCLAEFDAEPGRFTDVEIEAFVNKGEQVCIQKISIPGPIGYGHYHRLKEQKQLTGEKWETVLWVHTIEATGPLDDEIRSMEKGILGDHPANREGVERFLSNLVPRAFRRQIRPEEVTSFLEVYDRELTESSDHRSALREAVKAVLVSPHFLYRQAATGSLNDYEIAERLSYFLWNSMPDEELFKLAADGELQKPEVRAAQAERLLSDGMSDRFVTDFANYWLKLHEVAQMRPMVQPGVRFDATLEQDIRAETRLFFREVLEHDLSVDNFLDSDWSMLNEKLAIVYEMRDRGISGRDHRRVTFRPEDRRGGIIGQASFLNLTSFSDRTRPIARGVWVIENLMNQPLDPPKGIKPIETDTRGATSILEQIRLHRNAKACQTCHQRIDPIGIALENYGVAGEWRTKYKGGNPIETKVPEYSDVSSIEGVKQLLLADRDEFRVQLVNKLKEYVFVRDLNYYDLDRSRRVVSSDGPGLRSLIKAIVADESFLIR